MLVFAGFTPNSPLLLPSVNPAKLEEAATTRAAIAELAEELYATHPDTIVILADSPVMYPDAVSLSVADPYIADLSQFGDLGYNKNYHPDFSLVDRLQRHLRKGDLPITLTTDPHLGYAAAVPLDLLTGHLPKIKILPVAPSELDAKLHFTIGSALKQLIVESDKRVAVIAAGDLAHTLTKDSPSGYHKDGQKFDDMLLDILRQKNTAGLLQLPESLLKNAHDASYRQLCLLFGVLDGLSVEPKVLSYEAPFGAGYCVANFVL